MKSATVYFDQNVYDFCADHVPVKQLRMMLEAKNHSLVLGTLDLLEVASCYLSGKRDNIKRGKFLAQYFQSLLPIAMLLDIDSLMRREIKMALRQSAGSIYYSGADKKDFEAEIGRLATGVFTDEAQSFIQKDWDRKIHGKKEIEKFYKQGGHLNKSEVKNTAFAEYVTRNPKGFKKYRLHWARDEIRSRYQNWSSQSLKSVSKRIVTNPTKYKSFSAGARVNFFLNFKMARDNTFSQDFLTDLKHISNSAYMDIFVTRDDKCFRNAQQIYPNKTIYKADKYLKDV